MTQSILVTGASRGIGRGIALRLGNEGFDVVVHYHSNQSLAEQCVDEIHRAGGSARVLGFDVSDRDATQTQLTDDITNNGCLLYTSPSPRDQRGSRMPSSA